MMKRRVVVTLLTSVIALALFSGGSISQRVRAQDASQAVHGPAEAMTNVDPLQWSYRIDRYQLAGDSGTARGEIIYYFKCWMCHNQYTKSAPYLKDLYKHVTLESGQPVGDETVAAQIKNGAPGMPSFRTSLTDTDIADLLAYFREGKCCVEGENPPMNSWYQASAHQWPVQSGVSGGARVAVRSPSGDTPE